MSKAAAHVLMPIKVYQKKLMVDGYPVDSECVDIAQQTYAIRRGFPSTIALEEEWYEDVENPEMVVAALQGSSSTVADLFTFWQRIPEVDPKFDYHIEWEEIGVLPVQSYDEWLKRQVKPQVRTKVRKADKSGVVVKEVPFDDDFIRGMVDIFNESPIRQGRPFWHYGKDFDTVKEQFSRCTFRERMIGAYVGKEMIGFVMFADAGRYGFPGQIIASLRHRDKAASNALMAKSVEMCAEMGLKHMVYGLWGDDSLADFKRACGFEPVRIPRYWVPLTWKGRLALRYGLHRGWKHLVPPQMKRRLKHLRRRWRERSIK